MKIEDHKNKFKGLKKAVEELMEIETASLLNVHNWELTRASLAMAEDLMADEELTDDEQYLVRYAILFLHTGFSTEYEDPLPHSAEIAKKHLLAEVYPPEFSNQVANLILVIKQPDSLENKLQGIVLDTYYSFLGRGNCKKYLKQWWQENNLNNKLHTSQFEWLRTMNKTFRSHRYSSVSAQEKFDSKKKSNLIKIKKAIVELRDDASLTNNKNAQNMIKTTLRNQVDLVSIADKKAGIMISINSILMTLLLPLMASYLIDLSRFMIPAVIMVLTCGVTIITATLATRPGRQRGELNEEDLKIGRKSIFYFGNFYKMDRKDYEKAVRGTITRQNVLESSAINNVYDNGVTLGAKYKRLRICYLAFAIGIALTLITTTICVAIPMGF